MSAERLYDKHEVHAADQEVESAWTCAGWMLGCPPLATAVAPRQLDLYKNGSCRIRRLRYA